VDVHRILASAVPTENGCLIATVGWDANGYRRTNDGYVHRIVMADHLGRDLLPDRSESIDHECHNRDLSCPGGPGCRHRACVNIDHLTLTDLTENWRKGRLGAPLIHRAKTHCPNNHPYDEANTYIGASGWRECRACHRDRERVRREQW